MPNQVAYNPQKDEEEEEYSINKTPQTQQPALAPDGRPLPKWVKQLFDDKNPVSNLQDDSSVADGVRRSKRIEEQKRASEHIVNMALMADIMQVQEPTLIEEAMSLLEWRSAMQEKYDSIMKNDTWELVDQPKCKKVIGTKWVWKTKCKADGSMEKYKVRLVA